MFWSFGVQGRHDESNSVQRCGGCTCLTWTSVSWRQWLSSQVGQSVYSSIDPRFVPTLITRYPFSVRCFRCKVSKSDHVISGFADRQPLQTSTNCGRVLLALQAASREMRSQETFLSPVYCLWNRGLQLQQGLSKVEGTSQQTCAGCPSTPILRCLSEWDFFGN